LDCTFWQEQLVLLNCDELEDGERQTLENHLRECPECQQFQAQLSRTQRMLDSWDEIDRPTDIEALRAALHPKRRWRFEWNFWRTLFWAGATAMVLLIGFATLAWVGVDVKWKDNGLTVRFGAQEIPEITQAELLQLLQWQRQETSAEVSDALNAFTEQLETYLANNQQQMAEYITLIYRAVQSQRHADLIQVHQSIQNLAGATEAELMETYRTLELLLTANLDGEQGALKP
jgi:hypothetical protein